MGKGRITRPGISDDEYMLVTCTPETTSVEFFEFQGEAEDATRLNLHPASTVYLGKIIRQGEHSTRSTAAHQVVPVEVNDELRGALAFYFGVKGRPTREQVAKMLETILTRHLDVIRADYSGKFNEEVTLPGVEPKDGKP